MFTHIRTLFTPNRNQNPNPPPNTLIAPNTPVGKTGGKLSETVTIPRYKRAHRKRKELSFGFYHRVVNLFPTRARSAINSSEKENALIQTWADAKHYNLPQKTIYDNLPHFKLIFDAININLQTTSYELNRFLKTSGNPAIQGISFLYSTQEIEMLPETWFNLDSIERFLSKQLSDYASGNAPVHKDGLEEIGFTLANCHLWVPELLKKKMCFNNFKYYLST